MKKPIIAFLLYLSVFSVAYSQRTFQKRAENILYTYDTLGSPSLYSAVSCYRKGQLQKGDSIALLTAHLNNPAGNMFWLYGVTLFSAYRQYYFPHLQKNDTTLVRKKLVYQLQNYNVWRGNTENHHLLYHTSLYLLPDIFPELKKKEDWFHGKNPQDLKKESYDHLQSWIKLATTEGMAEFDSPTYFPEYMFCMALVYQFSKDELLKKQAHLMMDWLLIDFALDHLDGMMLGGHSREDPVAVYTPRKGNAAEFAYLYFGVGQHQPNLAWCIYMNALCGYVLPKYIKVLALNRSKPIWNTETHRTRDRYRHSEKKRIPVYRSTYVTEEYGLSSIQGGILQPIQQHTWSVRFKDAKPYSTIFGLHPYWSNEELEMYFEEKMTVESVAKDKPTYNQETKWTSSSPCESIFQYKNDLLALYQIPQGTQSNHVDIFFPKTLDERKTLQSGWIVSRAGKTYVGIYIFQPYEWLQLPEDELNHRLRSINHLNGYVAVVRDKKEVGSFEKFCSLIDLYKPAFHYDSVMSVSHYTMNGDLIAHTFQGSSSVNGQPYQHPPFSFCSRYTLGENGQLTIYYKRKKITFSPFSGTYIIEKRH